ncbi:hypothetical protein LguiB_014640 [Lonicera macranthoides]
MDVYKSLKRNMKIKRPGQVESVINFKYEKLLNLCFFCEVIGHAEKFCAKLRSFPNKSVLRLFGVWLRAPTRRQVVSDGEQYFWSKDDEEMKAASVIWPELGIVLVVVRERRRASWALLSYKN